MNEIHGFVFHATTLIDGNIEIGFFDKDKESIVNYSTHRTKTDRISRKIAQTLAESLACNIWAKIDFDKKGIVTSVSLEEYDFVKDMYHMKAKLRKLVKTGE